MAAQTPEFGEASKPPDSSRRRAIIIAIALAALAIIVICAGFFAFSDDIANLIGLDNDTASSLISSDNIVTNGSVANVNDLVSHENAVWSVTDGGLLRWREDQSFAHFRGSALGLPDDFMQAIAIAPDGALWLGGGGVAVVRPVGDTLVAVDYYNQDDNLGAGVVHALAVEPSGRVWAGGPATSKSPLSMFDGNDWSRNPFEIDSAVPDDLALNIVSILAPGDELWVGLRAGGLLHFNGSEWRHYGLESGFGGPELADARIRQLMKDDTGVVWAAASDAGLFRFFPDRNQWERVSTIDQEIPIKGIAQLGDRSIVIAGDAFVARTQDYGQTWEIIGDASADLGNDIKGLAEDPAGQIWAGAYSGGVSIFSEGQWQHLQR